MQMLFWAAGALLVGTGLFALFQARGAAVSGRRRAGVLAILSGLLTAYGAALTPPDVAAAAAVRAQLAAELASTLPARQEAAARWQKAQAALPQSGQVPARYLRWNTTEPAVEKNLNLVPAILHTQGVPADEIIARAAKVDAATVSQAPEKHIGRILTYSGRVLLSVQTDLEPDLARMLDRPGARMTVVAVDAAGQILYFWMLSEEPLTQGETITVYGYLMGLHEREGSPPSRFPVLFGSVLKRQ